MREHNAIYRRYDDRLRELHSSADTDPYNDYHFAIATLLLHSDGVEVAAYPTLYPRECFADTDLRSERRLPFLGEHGRPSIKASFLKKCQSRCQAYSHHADLAFLMHDIAMARSTVAMLKLSEQRQVATDVFASSLQGSDAYWRGEQDVNADMVRQMGHRCDDPADTALYNFSHDPEHPEHRLEFPTYFITVAPSELNFPLPAMLNDFTGVALSSVQGMLTIHAYHVLIKVMESVFAPGPFFEHVFHYCIRVEFQGRGTLHIHCAVWAIGRQGQDITGRSGEKASILVTYLENLFRARVDVQEGSGWLNYINGYVVKASVALNFNSTDHFKNREANPLWRHTYRLLCKKAPLLPEVFISMAMLPHMVLKLRTPEPTQTKRSEHVEVVTMLPHMVMKQQTSPMAKTLLLISAVVSLQKGWSVE